MKPLNGKTAVITGGNSGIGYAAAKELQTQGATVIITGRRKEAIEKAAATLGVTPFVADQSKLADIEQLATAVHQQFGKIDILFINAGVTGKSSIEQTTEALFDEVTDINLKGAYFTLSRFIPYLNEGASVVFLSSISAIKHLAGSSIYSMTKAGLNSIVKTAALELAPRKIRVNAVSPGPTATDIFNKMGFDDNGIQQLKEVLQTKIPLNRLGESEDVAKMVAYFSTDAAKFITGSEIIMDGGFVLN